MKKFKILSKGMMAGVMAIAMCTSPVYGAEKEAVSATEETKILTLDEAVKMAVKNNASLKDLADKVELAEDNKSQLVQRMTASRPEYDTRLPYVVDMSTLNELQTLDALDLQINTEKYTKEITANTCEGVIRSLFQAIKSAEDGLVLSKKNYELSLREYSDAQLKAELGMISDADLAKMKSSIDTTKANMDKTELAIQSVYSSLNKLLGMKSEDTYVIDYDVTYEPLGMKMELETYITRTLEADPSMKAQEETVKNAQLNLNTFTIDGVTSTYKERETNLKVAQRGFAESKKDMAESMRSTYNQIQQKETEYEKLTTELKQAEADLETAKVNLEVGNITQLTYDKAAMAIDSKKLEIQSNIYDHELLKFSFAHPYYSAGAGGSGSN